MPTDAHAFNAFEQTAMKPNEFEHSKTVLARYLLKKEVISTV